MTTPLELLTALERAATAGPWKNHCGDVMQMVPHDTVSEAPWDSYPGAAEIVNNGRYKSDDPVGFLRQEDQALTIALRNHATELIAAARELAKTRCPIGLDHNATICSAGSCYQCVSRHYVALRQERDAAVARLKEAAEVIGKIGPRPNGKEWVAFQSWAFAWIAEVKS